MTNPVDEHFKQDLENIEIKPSKDLWAEKIAPRVEGKKERKPVLWYRAAAVLVILPALLFHLSYAAGWPEVLEEGVLLGGPRQERVVDPEVRDGLHHAGLRRELGLRPDEPDGVFSSELERVRPRDTGIGGRRRAPEGTGGDQRDGDPELRLQLHLQTEALRLVYLLRPRTFIVT